MYRFSFDIGTNSIGWAILALDEELSPIAIEKAGVRIFSDGRDAKKGTSLAVDRREARGIRRNRARYKKRRQQLMKALIDYTLMPEDIVERKKMENLDPYLLRKKALDTALTPYEFGRAIFHLHQRRGFASNRKTPNAKEDGAIATGAKNLHTKLVENNTRTLGEYLYLCKKAGEGTRARPTIKGKSASYAIYPLRSMLEDEFNAITQAQKKYLSNLTDEQITKLHKIIFYQRPLKPVFPGKCSLEPSEYRAAQALPVVQNLRCLQSLNHLRVIAEDLSERLLTMQERDAALKLLLEGKDLTYTKMRALWNLTPTCTFNLEKSTDDKLIGSAISKALHNKKAFGARWHTFSLAEQEQIVNYLLEEESEDILAAYLLEKYELSPDSAQYIANINLPSGYSSHCSSVSKRLYEAMHKEVISYAEAREQIGYPYKDPTGEILEYLPYYGRVLERYVGTTGDAFDPLEKRYGRIANPTVHIALNQLRRVVNELIKEYGLPAQVVLEVAKDLKNSIKAKEDIKKRQLEERKRNDARRQKLEEQGIVISADSMLRMRLWEELGEDAAARTCVYTGEQISFARLFSSDIEIEHILPFSRTLDNSPANKTLSLQRANRDKGNKSPYEAFVNNSSYNLNAIVARASQLPKNKMWRFAENAMERFDKENTFLDRQLNDTRYICRVAREYLCKICPHNQVWVVTGRLTAALTRTWGFPKKNRDSHLHHAYDAAVIGVTDRSMVQKAARHHAINEQQFNHRLWQNFSAPWKDFTAHVLVAVGQVIVSHKLDHGLGGELHNSTAYGILTTPIRGRNTQHRKSIGAFEKFGHLLDIKEIKLQAEILRDITGKDHQNCLDILKNCAELSAKAAKQKLHDFSPLSDKEFKEKFLQVAERKNIQAIKIIENLTIIPVTNKQGEVYKGIATSSNAWYDIYENDKGNWVHEVVRLFDANSKNFTSAYEEKGFRHALRLYKNDMVAIEENGKIRIMYVLKMSKNGVINLVEHFEANVDKRNRDKNNLYKLESFVASGLQSRKAKAVYVSPLGKIIYKERPYRVAKRSRDKRE